MKTIIYFIGVVLTVLISISQADDCIAEPAAIAACDPCDAIDAALEARLNALPAKLSELLDRIENRGAQLQTLQADMLYEQEQRLLDIREIRHGRLSYQNRDDRVLFRMHFYDWRQIDMETPEAQRPPAVKLDLDYAFDGQWFIKRDARLKTLQRWEIAQGPSNVEAFRLGKGPFPLPFAIRKLDVVREFDVELIPTDAKRDPVGGSHLRLTPRAESSYAEEYKSLELWVDDKTAVPVKVRFEKEGFEVTAVTWTKLELDELLDAKAFDLAPTNNDWTIETTPLKDAPVEP